jgi:hypothetical protein
LEPVQKVGLEPLAHPAFVITVFAVIMRVTQPMEDLLGSSKQRPLFNENPFDYRK